MDRTAESTLVNLWDRTQARIMAMLAMNHQAMNSDAILDAFHRSGILQYDGAEYSSLVVSKAVTSLQLLGHLIGLGGGNVMCAEECVWPAIRNAYSLGYAIELIEALSTAPRHIPPHARYATYIGRLRMALLQGEEAEDEVFAWMARAEQSAMHPNPTPFQDAMGYSYYADLIHRFSAGTQRVHASNMMSLLAYYPENAQDLLSTVPALIAEDSGSEQADELAMHLFEGLILAGRLKEAENWHEAVAGFWHGAFLSTAASFLRGDTRAAISEYEALLKEQRQEAGRRHVTIDGFAGYLYAVAKLQVNDTASDKQLGKYLQQCVEKPDSQADREIYSRLLLLLDAKVNSTNVGSALKAKHSGNLLVNLFHGLILYWLDLPEFEQFEETLRDEYDRSHASGLDWIATQFAALLAVGGESIWEERASTLRGRHGLTDATQWFPRKSAWERKLNALLEISRGANPSASKSTDQRIVWWVGFHHAREFEIEPREQKRDARDNWTKGRAASLKRLIQEGDSIDYLTEQDRNALAVIKTTSPHATDPAIYHYAVPKIIDALVGHPLVFLADNPSIRVELVRQVPEIIVDRLASKNQIALTMNPVITSSTSEVVLTKETPTRIRVLTVRDEHRRLGAIVGNGLTLPEEAEPQVLELIKEVSALVTVQSAIAGGADGVEQRDGDPRLHAHLLPHQAGLRMQLLVRPIQDAGPYFSPGEGSERVIADVGGGQVVQAKRELAKEAQMAETLIEKCKVLEWAPQAHGEWTIENPEDCLELLLQLQEEPADQLLVAWPEGQTFKIGKRLGHGEFKMSIKSERDWFAANGQLQIDEERVLDLTQLLHLVRQSPGRFVNLGNNEFLALTESFQQHLADLALMGDVGKDGVRLHPLSAAALEGLVAEVDEAGNLAADETWKQHLERMQSAANYHAAVPSTLQAELRDYQQTGFAWLARLAHWGVGACLADDMGLGKTVQTLALLLHRAAGGPALVVAPTSVCINWHAEVAKFAPTLRIRQFEGRNRAEALTELQPFDIVITSYGLLQQDAVLFAEQAWHTIVLDEAQAIKNGATKRSQAVMALRGDFKMTVSGTPLENHLGELFNLFKFINPGLLGSQDSFNKRFAGPIERGQNPGEAATARTRLRRLIQPFILRRTKSEVLTELPSRTEITLPVELSEQERTLYESLRRQAVENISAAQGSPGKAAIQALVELMKLRRACCNPHLVAPELGLVSSKLTVFGKLVEELLENKHKVLVFSQFVDHLALIRALLEEKGVRYQYLDGATVPAERKKRVEAFQGGDGDVFLISLKAGGVGINLTAADYVIHMDPWWNPAVEDQASDRAHRMGQLRPVTIYRLVAEHTIEESIVDLHKRKRDLADSLLEGSDMSASMSVDEIVAMLHQGDRAP